MLSTYQDEVITTHTFRSAVEISELLGEGLEVGEVRVHELSQEVHERGAVVARLRLAHARQEAQLERVTLSVPVPCVQQVAHQQHQLEHAREARALSHLLQRSGYSHNVLSKVVINLYITVQYEYIAA